MSPNSTIKTCKRARKFVVHAKLPMLIATAISLSLFVGCVRKSDDSVQRASEELKRLSSVAKVGLNYPEFSDRVLTAKGNMDVALESATDSRAKEKIEWAMNFYVEIRKTWGTDPTFRSQGSEINSEIKGLLQVAADASQLVGKYVKTDNQTRSSLDVEAQGIEKVRAERALRIQKLSGAISILNQLRVIDSAVNKCAIAEDKRLGEAVAVSDWIRYLPPGSTLATTGGVDVLGNPFGPQTVDKLPSAPQASRAALSDTVDETFWSPYN